MTSDVKDPPRVLVLISLWVRKVSAPYSKTPLRRKPQVHSGAALFGHSLPSCGAPNVVSVSAIIADLNGLDVQLAHLRRLVGLVRFCSEVAFRRGSIGYD